MSIDSLKSKLKEHKPKEKMMSQSAMSGLMPFRQENGRVGFMRKRVANLTQKEKLYLEQRAILQEQQDKLAMEFMDGKEMFAVEGTQLHEA